MSLPTSLYIHIPWCIRKCPYCDFNSHRAPTKLPESDYVQALIQDLESERQRWGQRPIHSIFIGGGTPSLFSAAAIGEMLNAVDRVFGLETDAEITLEANPGASEQRRFADYRSAGVNRLSIGVQSFNDLILQTLGRVHSSDNASAAIRAAKAAGFKRFNVDLMHGLPGQSPADAVDDLKQALSFEPEHISWYQLTLEPNTEFYKRPPNLPLEPVLAKIQQQGQSLLHSHGFSDYEVSAWSLPGCESRHNLNYWQFGDYFAIGAGAHGKITDNSGRIWRYHKTRKPEDYLRSLSPIRGLTAIADEEQGFEFMMNALRLRQGFTAAMLEQRSQDAFEDWLPRLSEAEKLGLIEKRDEFWRCTDLGRNHLDDLLSRWLPD